MRILIFGAGDYYERYKKWLAQEEILALMDNSPQKQGTEVDGLKVMSPEEAVGLPYEKIVILSFYVKEMKKQLIGLKVEEKDILHFYDLHDFLRGRKPVYLADASERARQICGDPDKKKETILLLSTDMLRVGGPAKVLFSAGKILKKNGYSVLFASMVDGELRDEIEDAGIPVIVDANLQVDTMEEISWIQGFRLLICNTINFYVFLSKRDCNVPVVWWLHDSAFFYGGVNADRLCGIPQEHLKIVSVGDVPRKAMHELAPRFEIGELLYGTKDKESVRQRDFPPEDTCIENISLRHASSEVCFAVIGYVEKRKGQDILVRAVRQLPVHIRKRLRVYIVGKDTSAMASDIREEIRNIPEIIMTGALDTEEFERMFDRMDVLVCPSREDPMPAAVTEAMRSGIPGIVSDAVGTAGYIRDGVEGWLFGNEDAGELAEKIKWCVEHKDQIEQTGRNARVVYERYFSMEAFEHRLIDLIEDRI